MKIAVLCWGSLHWELGCLKVVDDEWHSDGPELPLEFCRLSSKGQDKERVTLVISDQFGKKCVTYWQLHKDENLDIAVTNLACREGCSVARIASIKKGAKSSDNIEKTILSWLDGRSDIDAVIWTNLKSNWEKERKTPFSLKDLEEYLKEQQSRINWEYISRYFRMAPEQTQTEGRRLFVEKFETR